MPISLAPPGVAEEPAASSALVLAPHPDDEVLGCGGLISRWARSGSAVRVLFLTDGAAGGEGDRAPVVARRKKEAAAASEVLGLAGVEHLAIPDGDLVGHAAVFEAALRRSLVTFKPEAVLVPSPIEASPDHRAAFELLHRFVASLGPADPLDVVVTPLLVYVYEVNRMLVPNLLVDVGDEVPRIEQAMACYRSQQEQHDYLAASLGLRRYRTLTLPPGCAAAEAYHRLSVDRLRATPETAMVDLLGGLPSTQAQEDAGRTISVIVRTRDRPELLAEALESLDRSSWRRTEIVLVNDGGHPPEVPEGFGLPVVRVEHAESQGRAAAATAGIRAASGELVTFLDDDDLVEPDHLQTLVFLASGAGIRAGYTDASVGVWRVGPMGWHRTERRLPYRRDFDLDRLLVDNYIPFCTLVVARELALEVGPLDEDLPFFEDWDFLLRIARKTTLHHLAKVTCEYRQFRGAAHHILGDGARERPDFLEMKARVLSKHSDLFDPHRWAAIVDGLRAETVAAHERTRDLVQELSAARETGFRHNGRAQALEVQAASLEQQRERLSWELEQQRDVTTGLRIELEDHRRILGEVKAAEQERSEDLRAAYREIARLDTLVKSMQSTKAWRLHRLLERWRR